MPSLTFFLGLLVLWLSALAGARMTRLPANIWWLFAAQPLALSATSMIVFAGGILAAQLAPTPKLATLPVTLMIAGTAAGVIPAAWAQKRFGRKRGTQGGLVVAILGALSCAYAAFYGQFIGLNMGALLLGFSIAFVAQMRFAAIESVHHPNDAAKAVSLLMVSGIFAALLGPEIAVSLKDAIPGRHAFVGAYVALAVMIAVAIFLLEPLKLPASQNAKKADSAFKPDTLFRNRNFLVAVLSGAVGYAFMSYVMTAAPLSMHEMHHYSLNDTKQVVQSHIIAMYLPGLVSAWFVRRFGLNWLMFVGASLYLLVACIALWGQAIIHYWWVMVLLGVGWNFLYTSGTVLLPQTYQQQHRFAAQACNDFMIFFSQGGASLAAGAILFSLGWQWLILLGLPVIVLQFWVAWRRL